MTICFLRSFGIYFHLYVVVEALQYIGTNSIQKFNFCFLMAW